MPKRERRQRKQSKRSRMLRENQAKAFLSSRLASAIVAKSGNLYFLTDHEGTVPFGGYNAFGLFYHDCRYLNGYEFKINGVAPGVVWL